MSHPEAYSDMSIPNFPYSQPTASFLSPLALEECGHLAPEMCKHPALEMCWYPDCEMCEPPDPENPGIRPLSYTGI